MDVNEKRRQILSVLARPVRKVLEDAGLDFGQLQEIRMRVGKPLILVYKNEESMPPTERPGSAGGHIVTKEELRETLEYVSHYSLYAYEQEIRQGFITIEGGHRVGMAGKAILEQDRVKNLQYISSLNIRVAHEVPGCADTVIPYIIKDRKVCHTLIISPPCCGKTTLLRDLIRQISNGNTCIKGRSVGVVDERSELGGCHLGIAQNELGIRTDILDGCPKAEGMLMLIRSMSPQVIAVDEIGSAKDVHAMEYAMQCGCTLIASVHGRDMEEVSGRPVLSELVRKKRFERYIVLENRRHPGDVRAIFDQRGSLLCCDL